MKRSNDGRSEASQPAKAGEFRTSKGARNAMSRLLGAMHVSSHDARASCASGVDRRANCTDPVGPGSDVSRLAASARHFGRASFQAAPLRNGLPKGGAEIHQPNARRSLLSVKAPPGSSAGGRLADQRNHFTREIPPDCERRDECSEADDDDSSHRPNDPHARTSQGRTDTDGSGTKMPNEGRPAFVGDR